MRGKVLVHFLVVVQRRPRPGAATPQIPNIDFLHAPTSKLQAGNGLPLSSIALACESKQRDTVRLRDHAVNDGVDSVTGHGAAKLGAVGQELDVDVVVVQNEGSLDAAAGRALEVVRVTAGNVAMECALHAGVSGSENLEDVKFTAAGRPAGAVGLAILQGARDLSVEQPDRGHVDGIVDGRGSLASGRHLEFEEESLRRAVKAVVSNSAVTDETTGSVGALAVGEDDDLLAGGEGGALEDLRRGRTAGTVGARVREGVAKGVVKDTRARATVVVQEDKAIGCGIIGAEVGSSRPAAGGGGRALRGRAVRAASRRRRGAGDGRCRGDRGATDDLDVEVDRRHAGSRRCCGRRGSRGCFAGVLVHPCNHSAVDCRCHDVANSRSSITSVVLVGACRVVVRVVVSALLTGTALCLL